MNQYIAVFHWEGHSAEAPVLVNANNCDDAESILIAEAIKWIAEDGSHLDCDEETAPDQYVADYFHIDIIVQNRNLHVINAFAIGGES